MYIRFHIWAALFVMEGRGPCFWANPTDNPSPHFRITAPPLSHSTLMLFLKKYPLFALTISVLLLISCNKDRDTGPGFDMVYQHDFTVPAGIGSFVVHHFYIKDIPTRYQQLLTQHGKTEADITEIITASASLEGIFGDADFSIVDQASLRVYDSADPTDYVEIAYRQPVPVDLRNTLGLVPSLADAKRFMTGSRFSLDVVLWLRNTTQQETDTRLSLTLKARY